MEHKYEPQTPENLHALCGLGQMAHFLATRAFFAIEAQNPRIDQPEDHPTIAVAMERDRTFLGNRLFILA